MNSYLGAGYTVLGNPVTYATLQPMLAPDYIKNLPEEDGWGNAYEFNTDLATNAQEYQIISGGKNGNIAASEGPDAGGPTTDFDCDIVYVNGSFVVFPEGKQN